MKRILLALIAVLFLATTAYAQHPGTWGNNAVLINGASVPASKTVVGTNSSGQIVDASSTTLSNNTSGNAATVTNGVYLNAANSMTLINPLTTIAESWIGPSSTTGVYFKGGNVGIGTTGPAGALHVKGQIYAGYDGTATDRVIYMQSSATTMSLEAYHIGTGGLPLAINPSGGNVLIGTITPVSGTLLTVNGGVSVNSGTNIVYYCDAGVSVGNLCRGNGCSCISGAWVATSLKLD